jgi:CheY-like chemotaxis protein
VLLDLNLPRVSGHDVLMAMKADDELKHIPVLVISGSDNPAACRLGILPPSQHLFEKTCGP